MNLDGDHIDYFANPANKHNGTMLLTSVDAHNGASPSRRGDLHILGFVIIADSQSYWTLTPSIG